MAVDERMLEPRSMTYVYDMIQERAEEDQAFRAELLKDPKSAMFEAFGIQLPDSLEVEVHEMHETTSDDGAAVGHIVLPPSSRLSDEDMRGIAGAGWVWNWGPETRR